LQTPFAPAPVTGFTKDGQTVDTFFDRVEVVLLQRAFQRGLQEQPHATKNATFLLITGPSGTGKTRLARTLRDQVEDQGGYFLTGKFSQSNRCPAPYAAFCEALTEFAGLVHQRGEVAAVRRKIHAAVGQEIGILTRMIPGLARIVGSSHASSQVAADATQATAGDALSQFVFVFRMFLRAVCSPAQPMVLLLDDLQRADPCSLDLLMSVVTDTANDGLVLIATCRDHVSPTAYLSHKLWEIKDKVHVVLTTIALRNLSPTVVTQVVADALALDAENSAALGTIVSRQTQGNLFYMIEFLRWLHKADLLYYDGSMDSWTFDPDEIHIHIPQTINMCHADAFLLDRMEKFPHEVKEVLKVAACLGTQVNAELVEHVLKKPVGHILERASVMGVLHLDEAHGGYAFVHDGWEEAAYGVIPEDDRERFHLEIGRRLWRRLNADELDMHLFVVLSQMKIGRKLITRENERMAIASLCLHAGRKALKSSTFRIASIYLKLGTELVGSRGWKDDYYLTLAIYNAAAEMETCLANFEEMEGLLETVFAYARNFEDKIQAYSSRIYALGVSERSFEAIDLGVEVLKELGETFPKRLGSARVMIEMRAVRKLLKGKSDEQLLRLPHLTSDRKLAAMKILQLMYFHVVLVRPTFAPFVTLKQLKLTLQHGLSVFASTAFSNYGMLCIGSFEAIEEGFRFGGLGVTLLEQFKAKEFLPRVYAAFYGCVHNWKRPLRGSLEPFLRADRVGMQTGDLQFSSLCSYLYCISAFDAGIPLVAIERQWQSFSEVMQSNRQKTLLSMALPFVQLIHHYMGLSEDPLSPKGNIMDSDEALKSAIENKRVTNIIILKQYRMQLAYVFNDYETAAEHLVSVEDLWQMAATFERASFLFFSGMVRLQIARDGQQRRKHIKSAKAIIKLFQKWATHAPQHCLDKLFFLEAELASVCNEAPKAFQKYVCAIALAGESNFLMIHALANERVARHLVGIGSVEQAEVFFRKACTSYAEWGGKAKAVRLQAEVDRIVGRDRDSEYVQSASSGQRS
jgi:predicted ATPase